MIRECFRAGEAGTGIIFNAHMLKHEVGLDIDSIFKAPDLFSSKTLHRAGPDGAELNSSSLTHTPAIISPPGPLFRRTWGKLSNLLKDTPPKRKGFTEGEAKEEFNDALSPIHDEPTFWKVVEWIPCELPPFPNPSTSTVMSSYDA